MTVMQTLHVVTQGSTSSVNVILDLETLGQDLEELETARVKYLIAKFN